MLTYEYSWSAGKCVTYKIWSGDGVKVIHGSHWCVVHCSTNHPKEIQKKPNVTKNTAKKKKSNSQKE